MIREKIVGRMTSLGLNRKRLADETGINQGSIYAFLSGNRAISNGNLDTIISRLGLKLAPKNLDEAGPIKLPKVQNILIRPTNVNENGLIYTMREATPDDIEALSFLLDRTTYSYEDRTMTYIGAFLPDGRIIGCVGFRRMSDGIRFKTDVVLPEFRKMGVYTHLFDKRMEVISSMLFMHITAFVTSSAMSLFVKNGFFIQSARKESCFVKRLR